MKIPTSKSKNWILFFIVIVVIVGSAVAIPKGEKYEAGQDVDVWMNIVGPFNNPSETFEYYSLPFCRPPADQMKRKKQTLGMNIEGDRLYSSLYKHQFAGNVTNPNTIHE
jgi:transmembrane 9 superfamily member 1